MSTTKKPHIQKIIADRNMFLKTRPMKHTQSSRKVTVQSIGSSTWTFFTRASFAAYMRFAFVFSHVQMKKKTEMASMVNEPWLSGVNALIAHFYGRFVATVLLSPFSQFSCKFPHLTRAGRGEETAIISALVQLVLEVFTGTCWSPTPLLIHCSMLGLINHYNWLMVKDFQSSFLLHTSLHTPIICMIY